jgi:hypothetical protein
MRISQTSRDPSATPSLWNPLVVRKQAGGVAGLLWDAPQRAKTELQCASAYKFTITPCTMKDGPSWGPLARYRRCGPAGGTDLPCTVRSSPRSDGSRRLRFVIDLPPNQLGPSWRKKAG